MEANAHFSFSSAPSASGPKPSSASGDSAFSPGSALGKSMNGAVNVNGFSAVPDPSGPAVPSSPPAGAQPLRPCDCLWDYAAFPGHGSNLRAPELWGSGGAMGLHFDSQELYEAFHEQSFELLPHGPTAFYGAAPPFPEEPGDGGTDGAAKDVPGALTESGGGLVGSMELEETQPGLKMCGYNGAAPGAGGSGLGSASPIAPPLEDAPILSEDPLEPFGSLGAAPPDLYAMDDAPLGSDKSPLGTLHDAPFSLLPPALHESSVEVQSSSPMGLGGSGSLELPPAMGTPGSAAPSEEEEEEEDAADSSPGAPSAPGAAVLSSSASGDAPRRRIATQEEVRFPLQHGWRREVRIRKGNHRWQGETWYYGPCGKRMKQFPEVIKYLSRNAVQDVRREHFSFSPRMPVGDFYEERETPEGLQWVMLSPEEIPSRIQAITGKRGRPRNADRAKDGGGTKRGRGRPPKARMDLLSKADARMLRRLQAQEVLSEEDKVKMSKIKKKMRRKAKSKQKQEAKAPRAKEVKKKCKAKEKKGKVEKGKDKAHPKERKGKGTRKAEKGPTAQRRREERQRQQFILEEMRRPTEDMCLGDHQPLPVLSRIPGLVLPGAAFSRCLAVVEFLRSYGRVLGLEPGRDVPSLSTLQDGLLGLGDSAGRLQDLLVRLLRAALGDPGLPPYCQSLKILGEKVSEISLTRDTVSEILRCFLTAHGAAEELCEGLRTKPFQALPPHTKASILAFLVDELNSSALIISEIDKTLESMASYRKNKWIIEGRLRRLKVALAKRTGRPESELRGLEDGRRRRSSRLSEDPALDMEEEEELRGGRRYRREEEIDASGSSIPELERQIEKLAKRQMFFRKKLLHSSQTLRAAALGQDRYRRRYWVLPHLGGIFVEGAEAAEPDPPEVKVPPVKPEPLPVPIPTRVPPPPTSRSRGRPRKSKEELRQHCGPRPPPPGLNGALEDPMAVGQSQHDLSQSAFLSWLSRTQTALLQGSVHPPDGSPMPVGPTSDPPDEEEEEEEEEGPPKDRQRPWVGPCSDPAPTAASSTALQRGQHKGSARQLNGLPMDDSTAPLLASTPVPAGTRTPGSCPRGRGSLDPPGGQPKRRGRPPTKFFKQMEQRLLTQQTEQPVPPEMQSGWWWLQHPEELEAVARALHPRGIREKALHKHLTKHKEFLREVCLRASTDPIFHPRPEAAGAAVSQEALARWSTMDRAYETDLAVLQWVEELEQRVLMADLQIRGWTCPSPDSTRDDLRYCEHKVEPLEDITLRSRRDGIPLRRESTNPLDLAVLRLAALERNVERRYLKEPLWALHEVVVEKVVLSSAEELSLAPAEIAYEITPRVRTWRQTLERCRSAAQVSLCIYQLEKSIAWEKSVNRVTCLVCRRGDDDEHLLLCDGCDRGCHLYCHRPKMSAVPEGDWFCSVCVARAGQFQDPISPRRGTKRKRGRGFGGGLREEEEEEESPRRRRRREGLPPPRCPGEGLSPAKRRGVTLRSQPSDLTCCEIILMEMEAHEDAWPFLEPVNPRLVPGYRKVIKNPMDLGTMRTRLLRGGYSTSAQFAADVSLIFDNCRTFNADESAVGRAGRGLRRFFETRWAELYQGKHVTAP